METYCSVANWTKEIEGKIMQYTFVKEVYLEGIENEERNIILKIQDIINKMQIKNNQELEDFLDKNIILEFDKEINFNIRRIQYHFKGDNLIINNCVILFLMKKEND